MSLVHNTYKHCFYSGREPKKRIICLGLTKSFPISGLLQYPIYKHVTYIQGDHITYQNRDTFENVNWGN